MVGEPWRRAFEELDDGILGAQKMAEGAYWSSIAIACALIETGLIDKVKLLEIIDSLHAVAAAWADGDLGDPRDLLLGLEKLREFVELPDVTAGNVLRFLRETERVEAALFLLRPRPPAPPRG